MTDIKIDSEVSITTSAAAALENISKCSICKCDISHFSQALCNGRIASEMALCDSCSENIHKSCMVCGGALPLFHKCSHCQMCDRIVCNACSVICCNYKHDLTETRFCEGCFKKFHICRLCKSMMPLGSCRPCHICVSTGCHRRVCSNCVIDECPACDEICKECYEAYHAICPKCAEIGRETPVCYVYINHDVHSTKVCDICTVSTDCTTIYAICANSACGQIKLYYVCSNKCVMGLSQQTKRCDACRYRLAML